MKGAAVFAVCLLALSGHVFGEKECTPLTEVAAGNSILLKAVKKAGLLDTLTGDGAALTIFAPTDAAFLALLDKLGISADDLWKQPEVLKEILTYHVLGSPAKAADLVSGQAYTTLSTGNSCGVADVNVEIGGGTVTIKGGLTEAKVTTADVEACENTVVHVIDTVLVPCPPSFTGGLVSGSSAPPAESKGSMTGGSSAKDHDDHEGHDDHKKPAGGLTSGSG